MKPDEAAAHRRRTGTAAAGVDKLKLNPSRHQWHRHTNTKSGKCFCAGMRDTISKYLMSRYGKGYFSLRSATAPPIGRKK
jgi:hypothetical protein